MTARIVLDHRGVAVERTAWRTYAVLAHTFTASSKVVARSVLGRLSPAKVDRVVDRWCDHVFRLSRTTLAVTGQDLVPRGVPCVVLANHTSLLDIPAVCKTWPGRVRFVAKQELRSVPMFGRAMEQSGIVFVDRGDRARAIQQLEAARGLAAEGTSIWIAAEGGRSRDGTLGPFKKGPFHVALQLQAPIVPAWISGTKQVISPESWASTTGQTVTVHYGEAVPTRGLTVADLPALMRRVREGMTSLAPGESPEA